MADFGPELDAYEREAASRIGALAAHDARREMAAHLDADFAARIEWGIPPEIARAESLAAIGDLRTAARHESSGWDARLFLIPFAAAAFWELHSHVALPLLVQHVLFLLPLLFTLFVSIRSVRVRYIELPLGGLAATVCLVLLLALIRRPVHISAIDVAAGWALFGLPYLFVHVIAAACARDRRLRRARG